ncbi:MAG: PAS domain S-box protein [Desulfobacteraceae bacterium]|nr:MAG: PAS domain S-box protein [Desulfobacteraceae bacterium]
MNNIKQIILKMSSNIRSSIKLPHGVLFRELQENEEQYQSLLDDAPVGYFEYNVHGRITRVNKTELEMLGYSSKEVLGRHPWEFVVEQEESRNQMSSKLAGKMFPDKEFEWSYRRKDGSTFSALCRNRILRNKEGKIIGIRSITQDITDFKRMAAARRKNEELYRSLFENMLNGFAYCKMIFDHGCPQDFVYLIVNSAFESLTGLKNVVGKKVSEVIPGIRESDRELIEICGRVALAGKPERFEKYVEALKMLFSISVYCPEKEYFVAVFDVITECKQAEAALRESEERYRTIYDNSSDALFIQDFEGRFLDVNCVTCEQLGYTEEELMGMSVTDIYAPEHSALEKDCFEAFRKNGIAIFETAYVAKDGRNIPIELSSRIIEYRGHPAILSIARDITERKRAEKELRKSEQLLKDTQAISKVGGWEYDVVNRRLTWTDEVYRIYGVDGSYDPNEIRKDTHFYLGEDQDIIAQAFNNAVISGKPYDLVCRFNSAGGEQKWVRTVGNPIVKDGNVIKVVGSIVDITEQKEAAAEREKLKTAIEQTAEMIVITDAEGTIQYANHAFEAITGYTNDETIGRNPRILKSGRQDDAFYKGLWDRIHTGNRWTGRLINKRKDGILYTAECSISPVKNEKGHIVNLVWISRDVTSEINLHEQLRQSQRMEAIGTLAGGIAHDFNNILYSIIGYAEMGVDKAEKGSKSEEYFKEILTGCNRAAQLTKNILAFCRQEEPVMKPIRIQPIIDEIFNFMRSSIPSTIEIIKRIDPECGPVMGDPAQIHQVLANLFTNASHAIQNAYAYGHITVDLTETDIVSGYHVSLKPGRYIRLSVSDDGCGIKSKDMERIFDPYFTTKEPGKGSGLGLSIVQGIIKNHNGEIMVYSEPGKGSTFNVYFPKLLENTNEIENQIEISVQSIPIGKENILLVDDDPSVVKMLNMFLEDIGYRVTAYADGREALEEFRLNPSKYDVVITDMTMPQMAGDVLSKELLKIRSDIPIILCTGFNESINEEAAKAIGILEFIMKPVEKRKIVQLIRKVING